MLRMRDILHLPRVFVCWKPNHMNPSGPRAEDERLRYRHPSKYHGPSRHLAHDGLVLVELEHLPSVLEGDMLGGFKRQI